VLDSAIGFLRCPQCACGGAQCAGGGALTRAGESLRCAAGHSFDIARSGYVSLFPAGDRKNPGDTAAMVAARHDFLTAGHFAGLSAALAETAAAADLATGCVADVGAGTGYYLAAVLDRLPGHVGLALDASKSALRLAARAHDRVAAVGCDAWRQLPVGDQAVDLALSVFAPRNATEIARIVRPGGLLLIGTPAADHLSELIGPLDMLTVDEAKDARLAAKLGPHFEREAATEYRATVPLDHRAVGLLVTMGPSSWHTEPGDLAASIAGLPDPVRVTFAVRLASYRPRA